MGGVLWRIVGDNSSYRFLWQCILLGDPRTGPSGEWRTCGTVGEVIRDIDKGHEPHQPKYSVSKAALRWFPMASVRPFIALGWIDLLVGSKTKNSLDVLATWGRPICEQG